MNKLASPSIGCALALAAGGLLTSGAAFLAALLEILSRGLSNGRAPWIPGPAAVLTIVILTVSAGHLFHAAARCWHREAGRFRRLLILPTAVWSVSVVWPIHELTPVREGVAVLMLAMLGTVMLTVKPNRVIDPEWKRHLLCGITLSLALQWLLPALMGTPLGILMILLAFGSAWTLARGHRTASSILVPLVYVTNVGALWVVSADGDFAHMGNVLGAALVLAAMALALVVRPFGPENPARRDPRKANLIRS